MSITVSFASTSKRENSTKQLTMTATKDCTFKNGCSMLNPILLLEIESTSFPDYTACKIGDKYYKITDIRSVRNNLFEIYCEIDVLATYKANILASTQFVSYSSHKSSVWLPDTRIPLQKNSLVDHRTTTMNFLFNDVGFFVLSAVGENGCQTYGLDKTMLNSLIQNVNYWKQQDQLAAESPLFPYHGSGVNGVDFPMINDNIDTLGECLSKSISASATALGASLENMTQALNNTLTAMGYSAVQSGVLGNAYTDAPNCVRSCIWVPFFASFFVTGASGETIHLGAYDTGVAAMKCKVEPESRPVSVQIPWHYSDWRRAVCEEVYLYLPMVGMVNIPSDEIVNETQIDLTWSATATDGCIAYEVKAGNQVIGTYGASCAVNYPVGFSQQASAGEIVQSIIAGTEKTVSAGIQTAKGIEKGSVAGTAGGAIQTALAAGTSIYDNFNTALTRHNSCIGGIGGGAGVGLELDLTCFTVAHPTVVAPDDMEVTMGLPTMKPMSLANLTGYCQCANAHVDAPATETELALLDRYLNSGFFIE